MQIDEDEEAEEAVAIENKKRWRRKRNEPPKRQWVLQEQVEFLETMMAKRQKKTDIYPAGKISSRYEGHPDHNPSHYVLFECKTANSKSAASGAAPSIQVTLLPAPPNSNITFAQPAARKGLSMNEAELAIQDQRNQLTRYMMHNKNQNSFLAHHGGKQVDGSKARLMGKLVKVAAKQGADDNDDNDDIMGDLAFRERKGNTKARKELLSSMGDDGVRVDDDGVLGGANDDEFAGKRHFGAFKASEEEKKNAAATDGATSAEKGNAGMAMDDGFYQRDVKAEYEELDYDVEEQFDDDDVDIGETEVITDGGFAQEEDDENEDDEEFEDADNTVTGAAGLASVAGFKAMLAKALNPGAVDANTEAEKEEGNDAGMKDAKKAVGKSKKSSAKADEQASHLEDIFNAAEKFKEKSTAKIEEKEVPKAGDAVEAPTVDADGLRIITLPAVRKEIWLNHGQIPMKRLMKLFDIKKKSSADRQNKFREVVKELCTMKTDPVGGRMLVLKQHYQNMG